MQDLKFSVVTVVYNGEAVIRKTMESVLMQTVRPFEYIIIDGKSKDNTLSIIKQFIGEFESKGIKVKLLSEPDTGIYNAMNKAISMVEGDFVSFINAGDWYLEDALEKIQTFYNQEAFDLTYGNLNYVRPDGTSIIKKSRLDNVVISSRNWNHPSMFLRTGYYKHHMFDETFKIYADFDLYLSLRKMSGVKIRVIDEVITNFVADGVSTSTDLHRLLKRMKEKYRAYRNNGYSRLYFFEAYGWEVFKVLYFKLNSLLNNLT